MKPPQLIQLNLGDNILPTDYMMMGGDTDLKWPTLKMAETWAPYQRSENRTVQEGMRVYRIQSSTSLNIPKEILKIYLEKTNHKNMVRDIRKYFRTWDCQEISTGSFIDKIREILK